MVVSDETSGAYALSRERMIADQVSRRGICDARVLRAIAKIPRHRFVDEALSARAYGDHPLPIGEGQTISQPYMVALMSEALGLSGTERVLEVGTGSGYQTAVLAELCGKVYSIERLKSLADRATQRLDALGYYNVLVRVGDGTLGWKNEAPFEAIIVTAGAPDVPPALIEQLANGGRIVVPVGDEANQVLRKGTKDADGMHWQNLGDCVFVKLIGAQGWSGAGSF